MFPLQCGSIGANRCDRLTNLHVYRLPTLRVKMQSDCTGR